MSIPEILYHFSWLTFRRSKGFIVINADNNTLNATLTTGLPQSTYCYVISGNFKEGKCTGKTVNVDSAGRAFFHIDKGLDDPMIAIHIGEYTSPGHHYLIKLLVKVRCVTFFC